MPEDIYFSTAMIENGLGNVPTFEAARHFAEESVLGDDPLGAHQIWIDRPWKAPMDFSKIVTKLKYSAPCQRGRYLSESPAQGRMATRCGVLDGVEGSPELLGDRRP